MLGVHKLFDVTKTEVGISSKFHFYIVERVWFISNPKDSLIIA